MTRDFRRNIFVLGAAICFAATDFTGTAAAQTKKTAAKTKAATTSATAATTAKSQKSPAKAAAKTAAPTAAAAKKPASNAAAKTSDKSKAAKAKSAPEKSKTIASAKTGDKNQSTAAKTNDKNKSASVKKTIDSKEKIASAKSPGKTVSIVKTAAPTKTAASPKKAAPAKSSAPTATATIEKSFSNAKPVDSKPAAKTAAKAADSSAAASSSTPQIIVSATSARVRTEPTASAATVSTVNIGRILPLVEENSIWYRVRLADDKNGWISKQAALNFDDAKRAETYQKIAARNLKGKMDFANAAQMFDFLTAAAAEVKKPNAQADLSLKRLMALSAALKDVPADKSEHNPYKDFLKANEKEVVYSEPSGEWLVRSNVFWELHAKFKESEAGEEIAWQAAQTRLPGECEGYLNCYLYLLRVTDGEYLNFYPGGKYSRKSIQNITTLLEPIVADLKSKTVFAAPTDISDRAEFNRLLTELRAIISKVPFVEKAKAVQQVNQIGEGFR